MVSVACRPKLKLRSLLLILVAALAATALYAESPAQSLFQALRQGDVAAVKATIASGVDVNSRDTSGNTPLMQAAVYSTPALLEFLLSHKADVNAANKAGHTAVMRAMPDLAKIELLVEHGADVNAATEEGRTPLMLAAGIRTAGDVVRYLIKKGAKVGVLDRGDTDAVMIAATAGAAGNLKILLDAGASVKVQRKNAFVMLDASGSDLNKSVIDRAVRARQGFTALMGAAGENSEECVRLLLARGADAKAAMGTGMTALHEAAYEGNLTVVKLLLEAGAPVNAADERGLTPLMMAVNSRNKNPEVAQMLLARGGDVHARDASGRTAADWARIGARREIVEMLPAPANAEVLKASSTEVPSKDIRASVAKSVGLLEKIAPTFFLKTGCISCHNVSIPMLALTEARHRGYPVNPTALQQMTKQTVALLGPHRDNLLSGYCSVPGLATTATYGTMSMHGEGYAPDLLTDGIVRCLMVDQKADGHWRVGDTRPPLSHDGIPPTALSARAMKLYSVPAMGRDVEASVARARSYLLEAKPWSGDDHAFRLLGLFWTEAKQEEVEAAARDLVAQQRTDGGWAQTPDMSSDAYATGLALSALATAEPGSPNTAAYRRGVEYLMRTQEVDGSWHVRSRAFAFQPYFESGFPHGHDQWVSMAATAWSAMALMPAAEPARVAAR